MSAGKKASRDAQDEGWRERAKQRVRVCRRRLSESESARRESIAAAAFAMTSDSVRAKQYPRKETASKQAKGERKKSEITCRSLCHRHTQAAAAAAEGVL